MATGNISLVANTWTEIAGSGLNAVSFQNKGSKQIYIAATASVAPTGDHRDWPRYQVSEGEIGVNIASLFSGVASPTKVWAYSAGTNGTVWRSHA